MEDAKNSNSQKQSGHKKGRVRAEKNSGVLRGRKTQGWVGEPTHRVRGENNSKKFNLFNQFIYSPLFYDNVPFLDTKYNLSKENFLKNQNYFSVPSASEIEIGNPFIKNTLSFFYGELNSLTYILETFFNCPIKLELNRLDAPFSDSNIMAQLIGINGKDYTFEKIKKIFFPEFYYLNPKTKFNFKRLNSFEPKNHEDHYSIISGLKIRVAGRFYLHRIIPRRTVSAVQIGSMARGVISLVQKARYTNKSKRGSFSVTV